jgi:hypothetical protein
MLLIAFLLLVPTWRIATSKGYSGRTFVLSSGIPAFLATVIVLGLAPQSRPMRFLLPAVELGIPLLVLGLAAILPTRPGAPGKAWRKITFPCPDCGASLTFKRELEGLSRRCPKCHEIVKVRDRHFAA